MKTTEPPPPEPYKPYKKSGQYVSIIPSGNDLTLRITSEGKRELKDIYKEKKLTNVAQLEEYMYELFDDVQGNSEYRFSSDLGDDGFGLTNAPGIIMGAPAEDGDGYEDDALIWYDPNYMVKSFVQELLKTGKFTFTSGND